MTTVVFSSKRLRASVRRRNRKKTMTASSTATLMVSNSLDLPENGYHAGRMALRHLCLFVWRGVGTAGGHFPMNGTK
jgi:hypothetical protein